MKRAKKTVQKRTYSMKGAIPTFVSLVDRGANFTPLSSLRFTEKESFGQDVEINRIVFAKSQFGTMDAVSNYLKENNYEDFSVTEAGETFLVGNIETEAFEDIQEIEYEDGVKFFIGKLKEGEGEDCPAAEITEAVEQHEEFSEVAVEETVEEVAKVEASEELVQESQEEVSNEEAVEPEQEASGEESSEEFSAETEEEVVSDIVLDNEETSKFADIEGKYEVLLAKFTDLEEKLNKLIEKQEEVLDEPEVLIQNSQSVQHDEIIKDDKLPVDEEAEKFSQRQKQNLFGLRG